MSTPEEEIPDPVDPDLPDHLCAVRKLRWLDFLLRAKIPAGRFRVAVALARFGNADGENVYPGEKKIADMANMHVTNARGHIKALLGMGLIYRKETGGGRGGATHVYRLTRPADITTLPLWLDNRFDRWPDAGDWFALDAEEHRAPAVGETQEHRAAALAIPQEHRVPALGVEPEHRAVALGIEPVDNFRAPETPSVSARNTERSREKHRALALPEASKNLEEPKPLGSPQADTSLGWRDCAAKPGAFGALVKPPDVEPWTQPPVVPATAAAPLPGPRAADPPRVVHASASLTATPALAAVFALLDAQPNHGEWYFAGAARELRAEGIAHPSRLDLAVRAVAILSRTQPDSETRSA